MHHYETDRKRMIYLKYIVSITLLKVLIAENEGKLRLSDIGVTIMVKRAKLSFYCNHDNVPDTNARLTNESVFSM